MLSTPPRDLSRAPKRLYLDRDEWKPLPSWPRFFVRVGSVVTRDVAPGRRNVIALALPTGAYAAAFVALGVIRAGLATSGDNTLEHLKMLRSLVPGTRMTLRSGEKMLQASLLSVDDNYIRLEVGQELVRWVRIEDAERVQVASGGRARLPRLQQARVILENPSFCQILLGGANPHAHAMEPRIETLILGHLSVLGRELCETELAVLTEHGKHECGTLQDVVRARCFSPTSRAHASEILTVSGPDRPRLEDVERPNVVIFDGAIGFLRWRDDWRDAHWVVILDRTEPSFQAAVNELNEEYALLRSEEEWRPHLPNSPRGVEVSVHREERD